MFCSKKLFLYLFLCLFQACFNAYHVSVIKILGIFVIDSWECTRCSHWLCSKVEPWTMWGLRELCMGLEICAWDENAMHGLRKLCFLNYGSKNVQNPGIVILISIDKKFWSRAKFLDLWQLLLQVWQQLSCLCLARWEGQLHVWIHLRSQLPACQDSLCWLRSARQDPLLRWTR